MVTLAPRARTRAVDSRLSTRRLRVAQVITKFTAGAGAITLHGAAALDQSRYVVTILAPEGGPFTARAESAGLQMVALRHMVPDLDPGSDLRCMVELVRLLESGRYDLVHTHSAKAGAIGRSAARAVRVPAIVHSFHGFPFHEFQSRARRRAYLAIERRLARITDQFVTDGTWVAAEAVRLGISPPERIRAISSPIDTDVCPATDATRAEARRALMLPATAKIVGTVARLDQQKDPLNLIKAMAVLDRPEVFCVWIGDGSLRRNMEEQVRRHRLEDRFLFLGERTDVPTLLPAFDAFVMPSLYEGLPCAIVEAMACGVPVVATAVNSVPEVVMPGRTGLLVRPRDPRSLARALAYLLDHPDHAARMGRAAREGLGDRFRPETLGQDLMEVYDQALSGARHGGTLSPPAYGFQTERFDAGDA
jgi:glycosyltransferase involved in cell wall biosynthesis